MPYHHFPNYFRNTKSTPVSHGCQPYPQSHCSLCAACAATTARSVPLTPATCRKPPGPAATIAHPPLSLPPASQDFFSCIAAPASAPSSTSARAQCNATRRVADETAAGCRQGQARRLGAASAPSPSKDSGPWAHKRCSGTSACFRRPKSKPVQRTATFRSELE